MNPVLRVPYLLLSAAISTGAIAQNPVFQWADGVRNVETPGTMAIVNGISVAGDGTAFIVGKTFGPHTIVSDTLVGSTYLARYDQQGECMWARTPGGNDVAAASGNMAYVVGSFSGTLQFGATTLSANGVDAYLAKYDAAGSLLWVHQIGGAGLNNAYSVAVDGLGMVHVVGHFQGSATFGGTTLIATHDSTGYLATYDANGVDQWAVICGGLNFSANYISPKMAIDADASGNTFVSGVFDDTGTFGTTTLASADLDDIHLARFDATGTCTWVRRMGAFSGNDVCGVGVTPSGNVYIYGGFWGDDAQFCGPTLFNSHFGNHDLFLAEYDGGGTCQWAQHVAPCFFNDFPGNLEVDGPGNAWITGSYFGTTGQFGALTLTGGGAFVARYDPAGNATLAERLYTATDGMIGLGADDDLFIAGNFGGSAVFDMVAGTNVFANFGNGMGYIAHYDASHAYQWMHQLGMHGAAYDVVTAIALDNSGNVYTTGNYSGSAIFCNDTLHAWLAGSSIFISKRDANGNCLWERSIGDRGAFGNTTLNGGTSIAVDGNAIYVAGKFADSVRFGNTSLVSAGGTDLFLARYDDNGNCIWARRGGGTGNDAGASVGVDGSGHVLLAGSYAATANIGNEVFTSLGYSDAFLARYDSNGNYIWGRTMGGSGWDNAADVAVDASGNSYVTGRFTTSAAFGTLTISGTSDAGMFLAKYDAIGDPLWVVGTTGAGWQEGTSVVQNSSGNIYVTGSFQGSAGFCTTTLESDAYYHAYLSCYTPDGGELWTEQFQVSGESHGYGLAVRPGGNIVLTGTLSGTAGFGGTTLTSGSYSDALIAAFEPDGTSLWALGMGGSGEWDYSMATTSVADANNVYLVGSYGGLLFDVGTQGGSITFDPGDPLSTILAPNGLDAFVAKFSVAETMTNPVNPTPCGSPLAVPDASIEQQVILSPNPVENSLTLAGELPFLPGSSIIVRDMTGRAVDAPFVINANKAMVDASALVPGSYIVSARTSNGSIAERFIKE
ncbi:MAG: T9SS type A sorting domain-containing protein [Flavobacteriales bacterium]|nr:T9SS type A sorting domain-containing protein [Flavobacteriales bacterium]